MRGRGGKHRKPPGPRASPIARPVLPAAAAAGSSSPMRSPLFSNPEEEYMRARFVYLTRPGTCVSLSSPDQPIPWHHVAGLVIPTLAPEKYKCPICLDHPRAPRITRCAHVFCCLCVHRLLWEGSGGVKCPMCAKAVHGEELRPVQFRDLGNHCIASLTVGSFDDTTYDCVWLPNDKGRHSTGKLDSTVMFTSSGVVSFSKRCMPVDSLLLTPRMGTGPEAFVPVLEASWSHIISCLESDCAIIRTYLDEVQTEIKVHTEIVRGSSARGVSPSASAAPPAPGPLSYARVASSGSSPVVRPEPTLTLKDLQDLDGLVRQHSAVIEDGLVWTAVANSVLERLSAEFGKLQALLTADTMGSGGVRDPVLCSCEAVSSSPLPEASPSVEPFRCGSHVVWYQATSGEFAFLDSLSTRVLLESVGNCHSALPNTVTVPIVQVDTGPLPDGFRGKYPFFHTLAVHTTVFLCEVDALDTDYAPPATSTLHATLVKRRKHRKLTLQQAAAKKRGAASLSPPLKPKTYEEQYFAVMGGKPPVSNTFGLPTDDFVETLPMDGLLDAFPVLPANEKRSPVLTAAPAATAPTLKDARDKEDWSFAKVIHKGGYFPALASTTVASGGPVNAWNRSAPPPPRPLLPSRASSSAPAPEAPSIQLIATGSSRRRK